MAAYVIVEIEIQEPADYEIYKIEAAASIAAHAGRYIARGGKAETLEGDWIPKRIVILEFESLERAKTWWASAEYSEARQRRLRSATCRMIAVEGL